MTDAHDTPDLDDVMETTEETERDRREHAKAPPKPDDDRLEHRAEEERVQAGLADFDEEDVPPAS